MHLQSPQRHFSIDINTHHLLFTYFPQHMYIKTMQKSTSKVTQGYLLEETLPQQVKEECQKVKDLFQFLSNQKSNDIEVNGNDIRFKIVRIKKERWYNLNLSIVQSQSRILDSNQSTNKKSIIQPSSMISDIPKQELQFENSRLKEKVRILKKQNRNLKQMFKNKQHQINKIKDRYYDVFAEVPSKMISKNRLNLSNFKPLKLQANQECFGTALYQIKGNWIYKNSQEPGPLIFKNAIKKQAKVSLTVSIQTQLQNNWIVIGLITAQQINNQFCYFTKNSIALENNLAVVFVELQTLKCQGKLQRRDTLELFVSTEGMSWTINKKIICSHRVSQKLRSELLYPFLMLSQAGEAVRVNCQQKSHK